MKTIVVVTDACIFIDLYDLELTNSFFSLDLEVHTTVAVLHESIEYHGMIWIFDKFVETSILSKKEAADKLTKLVATNFVFQNNLKLIEEIEKRLKIWI